MVGPSDGSGMRPAGSTTPPPVTVPVVHLDPRLLQGNSRGSNSKDGQSSQPSRHSQSSSLGSKEFSGRTTPSTVMTSPDADDQKTTEVATRREDAPPPEDRRKHVKRLLRAAKTFDWSPSAPLPEWCYALVAINEQAIKAHQNSNLDKAFVLSMRYIVLAHHLWNQSASHTPWGRTMVAPYMYGITKAWDMGDRILSAYLGDWRPDAWLEDDGMPFGDMQLPSIESFKALESCFSGTSTPNSGPFSSLGDWDPLADDDGPWEITGDYTLHQESEFSLCPAAVKARFKRKREPGNEADEMETDEAEAVAETNTEVDMDVDSAAAAKQNTGLVYAPPPRNGRYQLRPVAYREDGKPLRAVFMPASVPQRFMWLARHNTARGIETYGVLCGKLRGENELAMTHILMPQQIGTEDACRTTDDVGTRACMRRLGLMQLGWIHSHPTQECFMSSKDLHTHTAFQRLVDESVAIVCAPKEPKPENRVGVFRLPHEVLGQLERCQGNHYEDHDCVFYTRASPSVEALHPRGPVFVVPTGKVEVVDLRE